MGGGEGGGAEMQKTVLQLFCTVYSKIISALFKAGFELLSTRAFDV